ncbi:hypothetical protein HaLaN_27360 [Haematococcus lacustris]|uniref:Uncharacterized protein n=1 Tax=Haematococcus lacustris TaxID=44745 RepID=A0A6A0A803_HAELA|nr:hypothetical protein HaLaN_27360 [Haematococcus lacustris]
MEEVRNELLQLAGPSYSVREQAGQYVDRLETAALWVWQRTMAACEASSSEEDRRTAQQLCTLLLTDSEMLDVLLALHDIQAAQLFLSFPPIPTRHGKTCSKWDVPTKHLSTKCRESVQTRAGGKVN